MDDSKVNDEEFNQRVPLRKPPYGNKQPATEVRSGVPAGARTIRRLLMPLGLLACMVHGPLYARSGWKPSSPGSPQGTILYVSGSVQKICQVTGDTDLEFNSPTMSLTQTRFGLVRADHGYSFEHNGKLFFLFGDTHPTPVFNKFPNAQTDLPRIADDNDAIGFVADSSAGPCLRLGFILDSLGAYKNPVVLNARGEPAVKLRTNESPVSGISDGGRMFVIFGTDNPTDTASPPEPLGYPRRTIVAVSDDDGNTFHFAYNLSVPPAARFINTAIAAGNDGFLYFWGTEGDSLYRKSPPFLARKPVGSMGDSTTMQYLHAVNPDGSPVFASLESSAVPLFHDSIPGPAGGMQVADGMGELGVEWNRFVRRWVMLYNCLDNTAENPRGIYMRVAPNPWGPWSKPQTIFNPVRDNGYCFFIHRAVTPQNPVQCDSLCGPDRMSQDGGDYGPYFISRFTTGDSLRGTSTFFFTLDTWNPYTQVIMKASLETVSATGIPGAGEMPPSRLELYQNFPNPFNPVTEIRYEVPSAGDVRLSVFDLLGREVAVLVNGMKQAGSYTVRFDGTGCASGMYFYRLASGNFERSLPMLLLK
jgi:hypothetical protein